MPVTPTAADFNVQHSPLGAFASFTLGRYGKKGGFGLESSRNAPQDVYIALAYANEPVQVLPFYEAMPSDPSAQNWQLVDTQRIQRHLGWASDTWRVEDTGLSFRLLTPFAALPDPDVLGDGEMRRCLCPAILAELTLDNRNRDKDAHLFFGVGNDAILRPLSDSSDLCGIACRTHWGFAAKGDGTQPGDIREMMASDIETAVADTFEQDMPLHRLAKSGGLLLRVRAGTIRTYTIALGFYNDGIVTSGIAASYLYSHLFPDLETVLGFALRNADEMRDAAQQCDAELDSATISDERKLLLAHATHSYHAATMLLHDEKGVVPRAPFAVQSSVHRPIWVVNSGEQKIMNALDTSVDHAFWELKYHPWTLRNTLDLFVARYFYQDDTQDATDAARPRFPGGIAFTHDMGVAHQFSLSGQSAYELPHRDGCFSFMSQEQLCNWCLCAALYGLPDTKTARRGDTLWLAARRTTLRDCLVSMINRDGPGSLRNGIMSFDALRCGRGQEVTTFDSLDRSLGQARSNAYLAVKCWATYLALSRCFDFLGEEPLAAEAEEQAARAAAAIIGHWKSDAGYLPAVFEEDNGNGARIVPAVEGLVYPYLWGDSEAVSPDGPYGELVTLLGQHLKNILKPGICIDDLSGGMRLSSVSNNTRMGKIFLAQFVAEKVLNLPLPVSLDDTHLRWQTEGRCRDYAFTDPVDTRSGDGLEAHASPRGITAVLWMR